MQVAQTYLLQNRCNKEIKSVLTFKYKYNFISANLAMRFKFMQQTKKMNHQNLQRRQRTYEQLRIAPDVAYITCQPSYVG